MEVESSVTFPCYSFRVIRSRIPIVHVFLYSSSHKAMPASRQDIVIVRSCIFSALSFYVLHFEYSSMVVQVSTIRDLGGSGGVRASHMSNSWV